MNECRECNVDIPISYRSKLCTKCRKRVNYLNTNGKNRSRFISKTAEEKLETKRRLAREYYYKNKDDIRLKQLFYKSKNKDKIKKINKEWYVNNGVDYYNNRYINDLDFKLRANLRSRLNKAIKGNQKTGSAVKDLGCTIEELKKHLESQFTEGMTWDNWARDGWHIDHIKPLASFDLTVESELKKAIHYTNLQPLWAKDNLSKGKGF